MGFDFTFHMAQLCADMASRLPELRHLDTQRIAIRYCQTRKGVAHGLQATLTGLRFAGGSHSLVRGGRRWTIQRLFDPQGREMLYLLSFYLPRFLNHSRIEKLTTVMHELWHIDPSFNGDLRRLPGRCHAHGHSERHYDQAMRELVARWLSLGPPAERYAFLEYDFRRLSSLYGPVYGARIATPKLIPAGSHAA